jgi:hypothetical protein
VEPADHYLGLVKLGRDAFIASAAPAALVRVRPDASMGTTGTTPPPGLDDASRESSVDLNMDTYVGTPEGRGKRQRRLEIYPLLKKPSAPFPDMITVGRTPNNDVVLKDATVSRLHVFFRHRGATWQIADGGSKNGTFLDGKPLAPRRELGVDSGQTVKIGDLELTFYTAEELFKMLELVTTRGQ